MSRDSEDEFDPSQALSLSVTPGKTELESTQVPNLFLRAGDRAVRRFIGCFVAPSRNRTPRPAYAQAIGQFSQWCERGGLPLERLRPVTVAAYIEDLTARRAAPTVKQHLAAIKMLFDWLVTGQVVPINPA